MQLSRKWLTAGLAVALLTGALTGCSKPSPDQAFKQAAEKIWGESYDYEGRVAFEVKADDSAVLGSKGGLNEQEAQEELQLAESIKSPQGQQMIASMQTAKIVFNGAVDGPNLKYGLTLDVNFDYQGGKTAIKAPLLLDLKNGPALYVDPVVMQPLTGRPLNTGGKLLKLTLDDISSMTSEQKAKFKADGPLLKKLKDIIANSINGLDAKMFQDVDVSDAAKKAGAERTVRLTMTREQGEKMSQDMTNKVLDEIGPDFGLTPEKIADIKKAFAESSKSGFNAYMGSTVTDYSLNSDGKIVYIANAQNYRGAKHTGKISTVATLKNYGKPTFSLDPAKQGTINMEQLKTMLYQFTPPPASAPAPEAQPKP